MKRRTLLIDGAAILVMCLVLVQPILGSRWFRSHDFIQYPVRLQQLHLTWVEGGNTAGWCPDMALGFGLPWYQYYPPGFLVLAELFHLPGLSLYAALQAAVLVSALLGAAGAYALARELLGRSAALAAAALFTFMPYHMLNLLVRGGLYEFLAQGLLPWLLLGVLRSVRRPGPGPCWISALAMAFLTLTHNISALIALPVALAFGLALALAERDRRWAALARAWLPLGLGLGLGLFFWAPALATMDRVNLSVMTRGFGDYRHQFLRLWQLIDPYWNFGASIRGTGDTLGFEVGNVALLAAALALTLGRRAWGRSRAARAAMLFWLVLLAGSVFLTHPLSAPLWERLPLIRLLQFPYRLLAPAGLAAALLGAAAPLAFRGRARGICLLGILLLLSAVSLPRLRVAGFYDLPAHRVDRALVRSWRETFATGEYVPRGVPDMPPPREINFLLEGEPEDGYTREQMEAKLERALERRPALRFEEPRAWKVGPVEVEPQSVSALDPGLQVAGAAVDGAGVRFRYRSQGPARARCGQFWFPGWRVVEPPGGVVRLEAEPDTGLLLFHLPPGEGSVRARFTRTPLRWSAAAVSLLVLLAGLGLTVRWSSRRRRAAPRPTETAT